MKTVLLWVILVLSDTTAQLCLKLGAVTAASSGWRPNAFIIIGYSLYIVSFTVWMQILKEIRLFIALSASTIVYVTIAFGSHFLIGEEITLHTLFGTALIGAGVLLLAWKKKESSSEEMF